MTLRGGATGRTYAWRQVSPRTARSRASERAGFGPAISSWLSRMVTAPVDGVICAAVPVPPTQP